jgi:hypothetical protein
MFSIFMLLSQFQNVLKMALSKTLNSIHSGAPFQAINFNGIQWPGVSGRGKLIKPRQVDSKIVSKWMKSR